MSADREQLMFTSPRGSLQDVHDVTRAVGPETGGTLISILGGKHAQNLGNCACLRKQGRVSKILSAEGNGEEDVQNVQQNCITDWP